MRKTICIIIKLYQRIAHAIFLPSCRFHPSCSHYAIEAVEKYGTIYGMIKACGRILRCSPFSKGGFDPVK